MSVAHYTCSGPCKTSKPTTAFHRSSSRQHSTYCKDCQRDYDRDWRERNAERHRENKRRYREEYQAWYRSLKDAPCADCRTKYHHAAMQFDHLPGSGKTENVATLVRQMRARERVLAEIAKCELVCANCHAVRTHERRTCAVG